MIKYYSDVQQYAPISNPKSLVTREYMEAAINKKIVAPVRAVTSVDLDSTYDSTAMTLTQNTPAEYVVDGVTLVEGNRVLVTAQTDPTQNGVYVVTTAGDSSTAGILTRADDFNASEKIALNVMVHVQEGADNADTTWVLQNDVTVVLDSTGLTFGKFRGAEGALVFVGHIEGNDSDKTWVMNHGLKTENVAVSIYDAATKNICYFDVKITSENTVTISSDVVLATGQNFIVVISG